MRDRRANRSRSVGSRVRGTGHRSQVVGTSAGSRPRRRPGADRRHVQTVAAHQSHHPVKQGTDTLAFLPQRMLENMTSPSGLRQKAG